jgi:capsule polysaccharide export protein KpsE/RkpR|tara:strand:+ start:979 stop:1131 length:153 start_codon:yes stop_codon:yes gene_type:complete
MIDPNKKKKDSGLKVVQQLSNHNNEAIKSLIALVNSLSKRLEKVENRLGL